MLGFRSLHTGHSLHRSHTTSTTVLITRKRHALTARVGLGLCHCLSLSCSPPCSPPALSAITCMCPTTTSLIMHGVHDRGRPGAAGGRGGVGAVSAAEGKGCLCCCRFCVLQSAPAATAAPQTGQHTVEEKLRDEALSLFFKEPSAVTCTPTRSLQFFIMFFLACYFFRAKPPRRFFLPFFIPLSPCFYS